MKRLLSIIFLSIFLIFFCDGFSMAADDFGDPITFPAWVPDGSGNYIIDTDHDGTAEVSIDADGVITPATVSDAPVGAKYIVQLADGTLSAEQSLGALTTGMLLNTVTGTTGVLTIAVDGTDYVGGSLISNLSLNTHEITVKDVDTIHISAWLNGTSGPEALSILTSAPGQVEVRNFDDAADEDIDVTWQVPFDVTGSTVTFRVICWITNATGPANGEGVSFFLQGASVADNEILSSAHGTAVISTADGNGSHAQYDRFVTAWSAAVTLTGIAAGETVTLTLYRDVSDAADDYAQDIGVEAVQIKYSRALTND